MSYDLTLGYTSSKHNGKLSALGVQLIIHGKLVLTVKCAKDLQRFIESIIELAKRGDLHSRRLIIARLRNIRASETEKDSVMHTLYNVIAPRYQERSGGYTRIIKCGPRKGDNAEMVIISFV